MKNISRSILLLICLTVLYASFVGAQEKKPFLMTNQPFTFSLSPNETKSFNFTMKEDDFAEINWLVNENLIISFNIYDETGKKWLEANSIYDESVLFIAPKDGEFTLIVKFEPTSEISERQNISLEYNDKFKLPISSKLKDTRKINGYDVKILSVKDTEEGEDSVVLIEKNGKLKKILKQGAGV